MTRKITANIFIALCLLILSFASFTTPYCISALELGQASVIASHCNLYSQANFEGEKVTILDSEEQPVLITLKLNDAVTVNEISGDFAHVTTQKNIDGWIYKYYLSQNAERDLYPVFNGTITKDTVIHDIDKQSTGMLATKGTRIYLYQGFDKNQDYTAVQIALADSSLYTGYISTNDISPDGISKMLIVAITVIVAAVTIVLSLVFIRKKKKNKQEKKVKT